MTPAEDRAMKAVVLLSGGADSATVLALAAAEGYETHALTMDYGQRHAVEIVCAGKVARALGAARHGVMKIDLAPFARSALTGGGDVPKDGILSGGGIPPTYVPARNLVFLSCAAAWAESIGARHIFIGVSCVDYSGYPDCRPEFIESFRRTVNVATRTGVEGEGITVHAPFLNSTKADVLRRGRELGVDYSLTHSCYDPSPGGTACGRCDSCLIRRRAFEEAGMEDPART